MKTESIRLYGVFGTDDGQISGQSVRDQLELFGAVDVLEIHITSKGGDAFEGLDVYNALKEFPARKIVYIHGYAMSTASWVAMVGDEIHISENAPFMYHAGRLRPGFSTSEELIQHAETVQKMDELMAETYSARTGIPKEQILAEMKATTWLKAKEAVARGFAHKLMPNRQLVAECDLSDLKNVPEWAAMELHAGIWNRVEEPIMPEDQTPVVAPETPVVAPVVAPVVPPVANVVDVPALQNAAVIKERGRIREVTAVCQMAGCPEMVNEFIDKGLTADDVQKQLFPVVCAQRKPVGESGSTPAEEIVNQADVKLEAEWVSVKDTVTNMGVTKEVYFASRKQDLAVA